MPTSFPCISPFSIGDVGYSAAALAYFNRVTLEGGSLTTNEKTYINTFINSIPITEFDRLWIHGLSNQVAARVSVANAATADVITEVNSPTWTAFQGYTGNASTMYLNTNYNPGTEGVKYTLNNAGFGVYHRTAFTVSTIGGQTGGGFFALIYSLAGTYYTYINNDGNGVGNALVNTTGLHSTIRTTSNDVATYENGVLAGSFNKISTGLVASDFYLLGLNAGGSPALLSSSQISLSFIGSSDINQATFYTAVQTLRNNLGW